MFRAPLKALSLSFGFTLALSAGPALLSHPSPAFASETIDPMVTGSINPAATTATAQRGSAAFRKALAVLAGGDEAGAYALASGLPDDTERRTIQWAAIYYGNGKVDYRSVERFAKDAPSFAPESLYRSRLEQSLVSSKPSDAEVIQYLGGAVPNSIKGQILLASAYAANGERDRGARLARSTWVGNFLDQGTEKQVIAGVGPLLTQADHWARTVHLLMRDRASNTERMLPRLSPAQKSLAVAGIAVIKNATNARDLLNKVDPSLRKSPVFYFLAAQQARAAGDFTRAIANLNAPEGELPDAAEWWYERRTLIRQLLGKGDARLAYQAANTYTHGPEGRLVDARFHAGWIALSFLNDAKSAKPHFEKMLTLSTLPDTIAQGNYWLGRTLLSLGDNQGARTAFGKAAKYGTVYYGQLARGALDEKGVELRALPAVAGSDVAFNANPVVRGIKLLVANDQGELAAPLLRNLTRHLKDGGQLLLAARLAQTIDAHYLAIEIANIAEQRGTPLDLFSYPMDPLPKSMKLADVDKAAVYAVARQESKFQVNAVSHAGARGVMQLMPGTAKETAAKLGLPYSSSRLTTDSSYNALLGSTYLAGQLRRFDGSLALAAAGYNAGAGNAAKWVTAFGDPRASNVDPVVWVELIPFEETRGYVKRVLSNYVVYRTRLGASISIGDALRRIPG